MKCSRKKFAAFRCFKEIFQFFPPTKVEKRCGVEHVMSLNYRRKIIPPDPKMFPIMNSRFFYDFYLHLKLRRRRIRLWWLEQDVQTQIFICFIFFLQFVMFQGWQIFDLNLQESFMSVRSQHFVYFLPSTAKASGELCLYLRRIVCPTFMIFITESTEWSYFRKKIFPKKLSSWTFCRRRGIYLSKILWTFTQRTSKQLASVFDYFEFAAIASYSRLLSSMF